ncbi:MAG: hypothetical protein HY351_00445 [Candidatus Omnitrophica bacterium]|nr:hypothetical protein [Candidatus Omnitrophota bacterium]
MLKKSNYNYRTANSVQKLFCELPKSTIQKLARRVKTLAASHGLTYTDDEGKTAVINLTLRPRLIHASLEKALWKVIRALDGAFYKIAPLYFKVPSFYELFPFGSSEREWLAYLQEASYVPGRMATRWDANTAFSEQDWKEGFSFFEVNGVGVGGMWYGPQAGEVALKTVVPELQKMDPGFRPFPNKNMGLLLLELINSQRKKIRRTRGVIALVMEKASGSNFVEFERLAKLYIHLGFPAIVIEPTDPYLKNSELFAQDKQIDIIYRDATLSELCLLEEKGYDLNALRKGFMRGQIVSSLEGEFDHKSAFEVFTSPEYAKFFTLSERSVFKRHILWTRLLNERKTSDPKGRSVDLIPFVLKNQDHLVLKPNRLYGGKGIIFGREVDGKKWSNKIEACLEESGDWVIQKLGQLRAKNFFSPDGEKVRKKNYYVVSGFFATEKGLGMVGRMSERMIVNVARRGGLTPILLIR